MTRSRFSLFAVLSFAVAAIAAMPAAAYTRARDWLERAFTFVVETLGRPDQVLPRFGGFAFAAPAPVSYAAPPVHYLRHEAGTATRGAHRNV